MVGPDGCGVTVARGDDVQVVPAECPAVAAGAVIATAGANGVVDAIPRGDDKIVGTELRDGGDRCAHTRAFGDDVVVVVGACARGGPNGEIVTAGGDGVLDTPPAGDDVSAAVNGYGTDPVGQCDGSSSTPGAACTSDADCSAPCRQVEVLTRVRAVAADRADGRFWVTMTSRALDALTDFDDIPLFAGDRVSLALVQDRDGDGITARQEFLYGSSDERVNSDDCPQGSTCVPGTFDLVSDFDEVLTGFDVRVAGRPAYRAFADPARPDGDVDRLVDSDEAVLGTDPSKRDTDDDGIGDFEERFGFSVLEKNRQRVESVVAPYSGTNQGMAIGSVIVDGGNGRAESTRNAAGDDVQVVAKGDGVSTLGVIVTPGADNVLTTSKGGDDVVFAAAAVRPGKTNHRALFATDPLNADTDGDGLTDGAERVLRGNPNDPDDANEFRDTDRDGLTDADERRGWSPLERVVPTSGMSSLFCPDAQAASGMTPVPDPASPPSTCDLFATDPFEPDSDQDGLPDLLEMFLSSNPRKRDSDADGLLDLDEFDPESQASIPFALFRDFEALCLAAERCRYDPSTSRRFGTSAISKDTDADGLSDPQELFEQWVVQAFGTTPFAVTSDPTEADADLDNSLDGKERERRTDPRNADTDGDGVLDADDPNPTGFGRGIIIRLDRWVVLTDLVGGDDCDKGLGEQLGDFDYDFQVNRIKADGTVETKLQQNRLRAARHFRERPGQHEQQADPDVPECAGRILARAGRDPRAQGRNHREGGQFRGGCRRRVD